MQTQRRFKTILAGDAGVGKSEFALIVSGREPMPDAPNRNIASQQSTIGVDLLKAERVHTETGVSVVARHQIWDTAGQERFRACVSSYFRTADIIIFIYDVTNAASFSAVANYWWPVAHGGSSAECQFFIIGTKIDMLTENGGEHARAVDPITISVLAERLCAVTFEVDTVRCGGRTAYDVFTQISRMACARAPKAAPASQPVVPLVTPKPKKRCAIE